MTKRELHEIVVKTWFDCIKRGISEYKAAAITAEATGKSIKEIRKYIKKQPTVLSQRNAFKLSKVTYKMKDHEVRAFISSLRERKSRN